jgi:ribosomal-protein-alanine N-acetyltransferase
LKPNKWTNGTQEKSQSHRALAVFLRPIDQGNPVWYVFLAMARTIDLIHLNFKALRVLWKKPKYFSITHSALLAGNSELIRDLAGQTRSFLKSQPLGRRGKVYLAVDSESRIIVGSCAFKTAPQPNGEVEIAYYVFPDYERRGYGTAMAGRLVELALGDSKIQRVIAQTLPEINASARILTRIGFTLLGEVTDPTDGRVWTWALERKN